MVKKYRRRNYLINKSLQLRYMAMVAILMIIIGLSTGWIVYSTTWSTILDKIEGVAALDKLILDLNKILLVRMIFLVMASVCAAVLITMFVSHRIAGPLFRVARIMDKLAEGVIPSWIKFRTGDELQDLAVAIDLAVKKIDAISDSNREITREASACAERLNDSLHSPKPDIRKAIEEVEHLKKYLQEIEIFRKQADEKK